MEKYITSGQINNVLANLRQIVFEVTDACNLKCKYCAYGEFYDDYDERENKTLSINKAYKIIDYLAKFWNSERNISEIKRITVSFYGGEPLLNIKFIKAVVEYLEKNIKNYNIYFRFSMTTNALLLHKYMDYLKEHDFYLLISLDGNRENTGYRVDKKGLNVFDKIERNVDILKNKYPDYFREKVGFNAVLHNKNSVEEIYRFFKEKYNKIPSIGELNNVGIHDDKKQEFNSIYRNSRESLHQSEHYEEIERDMFTQVGSYQSLTLFLHQYSGFVFKDYTDLLFDRSKQKPLPTGTCIPFSKKMFITVNGKILPCERIGHQFALGEITDTEIKLDTEAIAEKYNIWYAKFENQCGKCRNTKSCIQCMFNVSDLDGKPVCHGYMNEESFRNYVNAQMQFLEKHPEAYQKIMEEVLVI
jgi:uncharacterized protein